MTAAPDSYFRRTGEHRYLPTVHTGGGWDPDELHISPVAGLITHVVEQHAAVAADDKAIVRIGIDILGVMRFEELDLRVEVLRPGRTVELTEVVVESAGRPSVRARVWRLAGFDTAAVEGCDDQPLPTPSSLPPTSLSGEWPGGFIASIEVRRVVAERPGRGAAWISTPLDLVEGEAAGPVARFATLVDVANGIGSRAHPDRWTHPNLDLTVHLFRQPSGGYVGVDTMAAIGPRGHGLTSSVLHDVVGPVGRCEQILTVRPRR